MTDTTLAPNPRLERPLFDLLGVRWCYARGTVRSVFIKRNFEYTTRPMGMTTGGEVEPSYFLELTTPAGPVAVEVSERRSSLTQVGDVVPVKYRTGRRSNRIQGHLDV